MSNMYSELCSGNRHLSVCHFAAQLLYDHVTEGPVAGHVSKLAPEVEFRVVLNSLLGAHLRHRSRYLYQILCVCRKWGPRREEYFLLTSEMVDVSHRGPDIRPIGGDILFFCCRSLQA